MSMNPVTGTSFQSDHIVDRRQLRRKITFWRAATFSVIGLVVILAGVYAYLSGSTTGGIGPHIARISIEGLITGDAKTLKLIKDVGESSNALALLVTIESPGGTTTGSEKIYDELRLVAAKKPVVAVVGTMAASGGYISALGADTIFATGNSLVGSIGVLFQFPNFSKILDTVGIKVEEVKSSPLKAAPNGLEPTSEAARAALAALVSDSFDWFKRLVKERRGMSDQELNAVADGRVFTGRQSLPLKLIDRIGGEREAIVFLEEEKKIAKGLPVNEWKAPRNFEPLGLLGLASQAAYAFGFEPLGIFLQSGADNLENRKLDGLVSIWHIAN